MSTTPAPIDPTFSISGADPQDLSAREMDVIRLVTNCYTNQQIGEELYLSINSVKTYIRGAYRKIGASSRSHAVVWGVRHGLLEDETTSRHLSSVR